MRRITIKKKPVPEATVPATVMVGDSVTLGMDMASGPDTTVVWPVGVTMPVGATTPMGTVTGRSSSSTPNPSNIPRGENGRASNSVLNDAVRGFQSMGTSMASAADALRTFGAQRMPVRPSINLSVREVAVERDIRTMSTNLLVILTVNTDRSAAIQVTLPRELLEQNMEGTIASVDALTPTLREGLYDIIDGSILPSLLAYIASSMSNSGRY